MKIHPLNAKGKYYVDQDVCLICDDCFHAAPNNFDYKNDYELGSFVIKQPETPEEEQQCKNAMMNCPLEAILDDGEISNQ